MAKKQPLGSGLSAIFLDNSPDSSEKTSTLRLSQIEPRRSQPRKFFDNEALAQLADSIAANGLIQPIVVRSVADSDFYQIIAGERRWRAAKMAGLTEVPVVILDADDKKTAEFALIENIQREDLSPIEEAEGYKALIEDYNLTQEQVAKQVGKSRAAVTNCLRLLDLPEEIIPLVADKTLSAGHARTLLGLADKSRIPEAAKTVIDGELSVRATEELVKKLNSQEYLVDNTPDPHDEVEREYYTSLAKRISEASGYKVKISHSSNKKVITLAYNSSEELEEIIKKIVGDNAENIF